MRIDQYNDENISDFNDVVKLFRENNPYIVKQLEDIGIELGCTVSNIVNLLSVDRVIIGGEYLVFNDILLAQIKNIVRQHCLFMPDIFPSELGHNAGIAGLFALSREDYFDYIIKAL